MRRSNHRVRTPDVEEVVVVRRVMAFAVAIRLSLVEAVLGALSMLSLFIADAISPDTVLLRLGFLPLLRRGSSRRLKQCPIWPVTKAPSRKQHNATAMLDVTNILPLREGRMTARVRKIVLPVWLEAKQW